MRNSVLWFGIALNLGLIGYFKYFNFFAANIAEVFHKPHPHLNIILPLGISFFTFQQIAYLVDSYKGKTARYHFYHYVLFIVFFPQLIAGPILHHKEFIPQLIQKSRAVAFSRQMAVGLTLFIIGLFKKVVIADSLSGDVNVVFLAAEQGMVSAYCAWMGALGYTFQIYFDFSAYSEMAMGLGYLFGFKIPLNFYSPYKAVDFVDFWQRWHITLSRFLKEYLYIPLGGNRGSGVFRSRNVMLTMLLGGLWHGAAWTFVVWGVMHGLLILFGHFLRHLRRSFSFLNSSTSLMVMRLVTFGLLVHTWVFFRADTFQGAFRIIRSMWSPWRILPAVYAKYVDNFFGLSEALESLGIHFGTVEAYQNVHDLLVLGILLACVVFFPNTYQLMSRHYQTFTTHEFSSIGKNKIYWNTGWPWILFISLLACCSFLNLFETSDFLYFNF